MRAAINNFNTVIEEKLDTNAIGALSGVLAAAVGVAATCAKVLYNKFKRSGSKEIESFLQYAGQGCKYYVGRYVRRRLAAELTLRQYARLQLQTAARDMFVPATIPVRLNVDQAFIPLLLRDSLQDHIEYSELFYRTERRLIILGEPGSGKSSLFKRLYRDACRRAASSPRKAPVPVLFELRNLSTSITGHKEELTGHTLFTLLKSGLRESAVYRATRGIEDLEHGAGFLILPDGLDEVPDALSSAIVSAIVDMCQSLSRTSPNSTVLLSSRTQYFFSRYSRGLQESFDVLSVRPFAVGDIYLFLTKWPFTGSVRGSITRIFSRLRQLPSLTEMCTNPLALSMFVARDQQTGGSDLPETRSRFYESLLEELIVNRRSRGEGLPAGRQRLRDARQAVLGPVCLEHLLSRDEAPNSIPRARFISAIRKAEYGGTDADKALLDLSSDTGLFAEERSGETERFMHLTLCEFMAAVEVVETGEAGWERLFSLFGEHDRLWESRLTEVVAFACGLAGRALRQRILVDLSQIDAPQVMLKAIIEAQAYDEEVAYRAITSECQYITEQPPGGWNTEWFSRLRTMVGVLRDAHAGRSAVLQSPHVTKLPTSSGFLMNLIERYNAEEALLETLARQDADAAISIASETKRRDLIDHVAAAADDFAVLQGILSKCDAGDGAWRAALSEKALTERNIARLLSSIQGKEMTQGSIPSSHGWARSGIVGGTVYGELLDEFFRDRESWSRSMSDVLDNISRIKAPSLRRLAIVRTNSVVVIPFLLVLALLSMLAAIAAALGPTLPPPPRGQDNLTNLAAFFFFASTTVCSGVLATLAIITSKRIVRRHTIGSSSGVLKEGRGGPTIRLLPEKQSIASGATLSANAGADVRMERVYVLNEILNLATYSFRMLDRKPVSSQELKAGQIISSILCCVPPTELRCLLTTRSLRVRE